MEQIKALAQAFNTLSQRERRLVVACASAFALLIVFIIVYNFNSSAESIRGRISSKSKQLERVQELAATYREGKAQQEAIERQLQQSNVRLLSYIEDKGTQAGLDIPSINPKADVNLEGDKIVESSAELTLTDVPLNRLVDFLSAVEAGPGIVKVKYLRVEPKVSSETITAWVTVATWHAKP